ncbi:hypothetical protein VTK26DRAFT_4171 [Humicola hyalothermophila]
MLLGLNPFPVVFVIDPSSMSSALGPAKSAIERTARRLKELGFNPPSNVLWSGSQHRIICHPAHGRNPREPRRNRPRQHSLPRGPGSSKRHPQINHPSLHGSDCNGSAAPVT